MLEDLPHVRPGSPSAVTLFHDLGRAEDQLAATLEHIAAARQQLRVGVPNADGAGATSAPAPALQPMAPAPGGCCPGAPAAGMVPAALELCEVARA